MSEYREKLVQRQHELLAFIKSAQAQLQQAVGELNKVEGKIEAFDELSQDKADGEAEAA